jgi:hypothetical protein
VVNKELCDKRVDLARLEAINNALEKQIKNQNISCEAQILAMKAREGLIWDRERVEKQAMQEICDLKLVKLSVSLCFVITFSFHTKDSTGPEK